MTWGYNDAEGGGRPFNDGRTRRRWPGMIHAIRLLYCTAFVRSVEDHGGAAVLGDSKHGSAFR